MIKNKHIVTVLLQDYFHKGLFKQFVGEKQWSRFESYLTKNVEDTCSLLARYNIKATFFALGWIGDNYPDIIKLLVSKGHEIASAGYWTRSAADMSPEQLREDLERSKQALESAGANKIIGYRSAYKWLGDSDTWILDILSEEGYKYDASFKPSNFAMFRENRFRYAAEIKTRCGEIWEFPTPTKRFLGINIPISGGSYLRHLPTFFTYGGFERWVKQKKGPFTLYFHPWELDSEQPKITAIGRIAKMRQYRNLGKIAKMLPMYFDIAKFVSVSKYLGMPLEKNEFCINQSDIEVTSIEINKCDVLAGREKLTNVTVVIPCYNEETAIPFLNNALDELKKTGKDSYRFEFLFVDDCSKDKTFEILERISKTRNDFRVLKHETNKGVAGAIKTGIEHSKAEIVCTIDADCSYDPLELLKMIPLLEEDVDIVTASPYHKMGFVFGVPRWRLFLSKSLSNIYHLFLNNKLSTYTSCFRVCRRSKVIDINNIYSDFKGIIETLIRVDIRGGTIREFPTTLHSRIFGQSKMKIISTVFGHLSLMIKLGRSLLGNIGKKIKNKLGLKIAPVNPVK